MKPFDDLQRAWQADADPETGEMTADEIFALVEERRRRVQRDVSRRLTRELRLLVILVVMMSFLLWGKPGWPVGLAVLVGFLAVFFCLFQCGHWAFRHASLTGSVVDSLKNMIAVLVRTMRVYQALYIGSILGGVSVALWIVTGSSTVTAFAWWGIAVGLLVFLVWSYRAGKRYLDREFGGYLAELRRTLDELER